MAEVNLVGMEDIPEVPIDPFQFVDIPAFLDYMSSQERSGVLEAHGDETQEVSVWVGGQGRKCTMEVVKTFEVLTLQLEAGQTPLALPQPPAQLGIRGTLSVFDHLVSARLGYTLPSDSQVVMNAIRYADFLKDTFFLSCISHIFKLPLSKLTYATEFDKFRVTIRNRYRQLVNHRDLRPPPSIKLCVKCFEPVEQEQEQDEEGRLRCCLRFVHADCVINDVDCPYCGTCWLLLNCCVCGNPTFSFKHHFKAYNKAQSMICCGAQVHLRCCSTLGTLKSCPVCRIPFLNGRPVERKDVFTFLFRHNVRRRHDFLRKTGRSNYDCYEYLHSLCFPRF